MDFIIESFPRRSSDPEKPAVPAIAPFWTDLEIKGDGRLYVRNIANETNNDEPEALQVMNSDIHNKNPFFLNFEAKRGILVTWLQSVIKNQEPQDLVSSIQSL